MSWSVVISASGILPQAVGVSPQCELVGRDIGNDPQAGALLGHAARWSSQCELVGRDIGNGHFAASCRGGVCPIRWGLPFGLRGSRQKFVGKMFGIGKYILRGI